MSFWRRLFGRSSGEDARRDERGAADADVTTVPETAPSPSGPTGSGLAPSGLAAGGLAPRGPTSHTTDDSEERKLLDRLRRAGEPGGLDVDDAIDLLRAHHGSTRQSPLLYAAMEGLSRRRGELDPLRVACAGLLEERGQSREALCVLEGVRSVAGMMLSADLHAAEGSLPKAVSLIERVLARDIDAAGARERHERWTAQLGRRPRQQQGSAGATVVAPVAQQTSFRLVREVARGGAGTVYEAEDDLLGRRLAYKVYHRAEEDRDQIRREARRAIQLAGPGIIRILDADPEAGWLAAEWAAAGSLRDLLRHGRVEEVLPLGRWMPALLQALARVHHAGLVHSDLKPANVLFRDLDDPILADFGSCLELGQGGLLGTPGYLSPERLQGDPADPRDDVYAVGRIVEDVLAAREDGGLDAEQLARSAGDAHAWAQVALSCLGPAADRPANASAILTSTQYPRDGGIDTARSG